jgi:hypothetical protein
LFYFTVQLEVLGMRAPHSEKENNTSRKEGDYSVHSYGFLGRGLIFHVFSLIRE